MEPEGKITLKITRPTLYRGLYISENCVFLSAQEIILFQNLNNAK